MRAIPTALGYLRTDISGIQQPWDEQRMRSLASRLGYAVVKTVAFSDRTDDPIERLANVVENLQVDAVVVPGTHHFDRGEVPARIVQLADVITVDPEATYARYSTGDLPALNGGQR
ncbi:hypothetical protein ACWCW7_33670 [Nocardia tengchongensis]